MNLGNYFTVHYEGPGEKKGPSKCDSITWCRFWMVNQLMFIYKKNSSFKTFRASLVAQWLRICLLMQGTRVRALVWEDPACRGAAGPVSHNY